MNRFLLTLLALTLGMMSSFSQSAYEYSDFATLDDTFLVSVADPTEFQSLDLSISGEGVTWDYSNLEPQVQETRMFLNPDDAGYFAPFYANCLLEGGDFLGCEEEWNELTNMALPQSIPALDNEQVDTENPIFHYNKVDSYFIETIAGITFNTEDGGQVPYTVTYDTPDTLYRFPIEYGDVNQSSRQFEVDLSPLGFNAQLVNNQVRENEVSSYGTLITPFGTFENTILMESEVVANDTIFFQGFPIPTPREFLEYRWFHPDHGLPLLTVVVDVFPEDQSTVISSIEYLDIVQCLTPEASFTASSQNPQIPLGEEDIEVQFNFTGGNADQVTWDFDDGQTGEGFNVAHLFTEPGVYQVTVTACNTACEPLECDEETITINVSEELPLAAEFFIDPSESGCTGNAVTFSDQSTGDPETWLWDFGDGSTSEAQNPFHIYNEPGDYTVTLTVTDDTGESEQSQEYTVLQGPEVELGGPYEIPEGGSIILDAGPGFVSYSWNTGEETQTIEISADDIDGEQQFSVYVTAENGCVANDVTVISVITDIEDLQEEKFSPKVYPNPTSGKFTIEGVGAQVCEVKVMTLSGRIVFDRTIEPETGTLKVENADFASGLYLLKVVEGSRMAIKKLIVE
ncbi:T9SS type A sorting domain-containing protein [Halocola ammonii]